jgi:hypothetical protein
MCTGFRRLQRLWTTHEKTSRWLFPSRQARSAKHAHGAGQVQLNFETPWVVVGLMPVISVELHAPSDDDNNDNVKNDDNDDDNSNDTTSDKFILIQQLE